jgi:S1-C subfamily serine protease
MNRKKITPSHLLVGRGFTRTILAFILVIFYLCGTILAAPTTYAAGVPGGNVADPVVRAVDIAKPAVVRIITTLGGHLTVDVPSNTGGATPIRFPQTGGSYKMDLFGSGAFISAHGDILTADHVVNPPPDQTNQFLYQLAAQDVANYLNSHSTSFVTARTVFGALSDGSVKSRSQYDTPASIVYRSTDFTGLIETPTLDGMPPGSHAKVEKILQENNFENGDMAIVHVNMDDTPSIKLGDSSNVAQQDQLTIIGFPGNADLLTENAISLTQEVNPSTGFFTASVNKVYVSALKQTGSKAPLIQVGGNVEHGDSGGPALDDNGNIVAVVSFFVNANGEPEGTSFLQASNTARQMLNALQLDTTPGAFQTAWNEAFTQYSSTQAGHWHLAQQDMLKLQSKYPEFHAIDPFLAYASTQASKESTITSASIPWLIGAVVVLILIFVLVLLLFLVRRKQSRQAVPATQPALYQPAYHGTGMGPESPDSANSGIMAQVNLKDKADQNTGMTPDTESAQPRPMPSAPQALQVPAASYQAAQPGSLPFPPDQPPMSPWPPQAPQTPAASYHAAQSGSLNQPPMSPWPPQASQTPAASYHAAQSGSPNQPPMSPWPPQAPQTPAASHQAAQPDPLPVAPDQPPMSPWPPQASQMPAYGQPVPYGQQSYDPGQPARPGQRGAYQPYPPQQRPYAPYPQAPATPWPMVSGNTPYAAQQEGPTQRRQPFPTSGAAYDQPPQGFGAMPAPAQPQAIPVQPQQVSARPTPGAATTSEESTMGVSQQSTSASEGRGRPAEQKKDTASSMPVPGPGRESNNS